MIALAAGAAVTTGGLLAASRWLNRPPHTRLNYRGRSPIGTAGVVLIAALGAVWAISLFGTGGRRAALAMLVAGGGMGVLGYVDDVYGDRHAGGLVGHARALLRGTFTTGMLKAGGGVVVGVAAAMIVGWRGPWVVAAGAVVALSSNLANLLDLRPGRTIKLWAPFALWLGSVCAATPRAVLAGLGGAVAAFLVWELRERVMLGDTGAGLLGAALGVAAVSVLGRGGVLTAGTVLLAVTLLSEVVSFSRVIEAVPPVRWFDRLGRRPD